MCIALVIMAHSIWRLLRTKMCRSRRVLSTSSLKRGLQIRADPCLFLLNPHDLESASKFTCDPRSTVFSKSMNPLNLPQKCTICALFKTKCVDLKTYSPPPSYTQPCLIIANYTAFSSRQLKQNCWISGLLIVIKG